MIRRPVVAGLLAALGTWTIATATGDLQDAPPAPAIEAWAPGVFDGGACPASGNATATYRVDATVLLPLGLGSVPIASRTNVGVATFSVYDCAQEGRARLRALEFFAGSFPDRARGLNRLGFLREATRIGQAGPEETAYFGVITANREESLREAEKSIEQSTDAQLYSVIDGLVGSAQASNTVVRMSLPGRWTNARELYGTVRPIWETRAPDRRPELSNDRHQAYQAPLAFLGALQHSLRGVAAWVARGGGNAPAPVPYVHNSRVYRFRVLNQRADRQQSRNFSEQGLIAPSTVLRRIEYRIVNDKQDEVETFKVWVELPDKGLDDPMAPPIVPVAFDFRPRSFLQLRAVRVKS